MENGKKEICRHEWEYGNKSIFSLKYERIHLPVFLCLLALLSCTSSKILDDSKSAEIAGLNAQIDRLQTQGLAADSMIAVRDSVQLVQDSIIQYHKRMRRGIMLKIRGATCCLHDEYAEDYYGKYRKKCKGVKFHEKTKIGLDREFSKSFKYDGARYVPYAKTFFINFKFTFYNNGKNYIDCEFGRDYNTIFKLTTPPEPEHDFVILNAYSDGEGHIKIDASYR